MLFELIDVVEYLHHRNIVHCDIKPDNIIVSPYADRPATLIDFDKDYLPWLDSSHGNVSKYGCEGCADGIIDYKLIRLIAGESISIKRGYYNYIHALNSWVRNGNAPDTWVNTTLFPGSDDDEFFVQYGPFDEMMLNFAFFHPMDMIRVTEPLSEEETAGLKMWYGDYLKYLKEEENDS